jgi:drug/metabolite transporter (DMT)-like permease
MALNPSHKPPLVFGAIICTIGYFFIAAMGACSKLVSKDVSTMTILFAQNVICLILTIPQIIGKGWLYLKTEKIGLHLIRDFTGVMSFYSLFFALKTLHLVDGILLQNTGPLWIPFVVLIWLKMRTYVHLWWGMILGFIGIILILKPGMGILTLGSLFGITSGIFLGISLVSIRLLATTEPINRILFFYFLFGTLFSLPFVLMNGEITHLMNKDLLLLLGVGVFMFLAQILITYSFKFGKASTFAPIAYSAVVFSGILGWLIWGHIPDTLSLIGLILVMVGGILSIFFEKKRMNI